MPDIQEGTLIAGKYRLEARLDAGGVAQVWKALDEELKRDVALKILVTSEGAEPTFLDAFRAEAQAEAALKHPSIVEVFDWGHDGRANYIVMELLEGSTLRHSLDTAGPLQWPTVLSMGRQVASALAYAHHDGFAHGNLDPNMIMADSGGHSTVLGFGVSCRGECETPPSPDVDTYALGGVMYEALTGRSPFVARPAELPANQPWPQPLRDAVPGAPHEFDRIVMRAIAPDPRERYTSAAELQADLDALARPKSRAWLWTLLAVLAVLIAAFATWFLATQQKVVVPDVAGRTTFEATSILNSAGLKLVVAGQSASTAVATDTVVSETPGAGQRVRKGSEVGVVVSTGLPAVDVPSVAGVALQTASTQIGSAGLVVGTVTRANSATYPVDTVISSFPAAGTSVSVGTRVDLVVSAGRATVTMPDVRGSTQANATAKLTGLGLKVDVGEQYSNQPVGRVVSQGPAAGTAVPAGGTVVISLSQGPAPIKVPDLVSSTTSVARTTLENMGLVPITSVEASGTDPGKKGVVISQSPDGGTTVAPGSRVTLIIGN